MQSAYIIDVQSIIFPNFTITDAPSAVTPTISLDISQLKSLNFSSTREMRFSAGIDPQARTNMIFNIVPLVECTSMFMQQRLRIDVHEILEH